MNGLEALNRLYGHIMGTSNYYKQFLSRKPYINADKELIEKELKALEIIKNKKVNVTRLMVAESAGYYNKLYNDRFSLTKDEFNLIKEVMK